MDKKIAKKKILDYFKNNNIQYKFINEEKKPLRIEDSNTIYLCTCAPDVIGGNIETIIRFMDANLYCQSYYCQPVVHTEDEAIRAARIVNYMNMNMEWDCDTLCDHSFIFDEENGDIFNGRLIRYELLDIYFYEIINHILNYSVQQIADVCRPVLLYIYGKMDYCEAVLSLKN